MAIIILKKGDKIQKKNASGTVDNEYTLTSDFKAEGGRSESATAVDRKGNKFFVKKLSNYNFPPDDMRRRSKASEETYQRSLKYVQHQGIIYQKLAPYAQGGTLVIRDYAEVLGCFCYSIFPYVENQKVIVHNLPMKDRIALLKLTAIGLQNLHKEKIVHADLKPNNIIIGKNTSGKYAPKIIDFDDSFFDGKTPPPSELIADENYYSPELAIYYFSEGKKSFDIDASCITRMTDIFTLGIIFCNFLTGKKPNPCKGDQPIYASIFDEVPKDKGLKSLKGKQVLSIPRTDTSGNAIPDKIQNLVNRMLLPWYEDRPSISEVIGILSMVNIYDHPAKPKTEPKAEPKTTLRWKCKKCGKVNDNNKMRCNCGELKGLNPDYVK